jgi:hypothetical protein
VDLHVLLSTIIAGAPHAIIWTHADEVNQALLDFIGHPGQASGRQNGMETRRRADAPIDTDGDLVSRPPRFRIARTDVGRQSRPRGLPGY